MSSPLAAPTDRRPDRVHSRWLDMLRSRLGAAFEQRRELKLHLLVLAVFVLGSLAVFRFASPFSTTSLPQGAKGDPVLAVWLLGWFGHALTGGHNLFFSNALDWPFGVDLAATTNIPLLSTLALPVTLTGGPVAAFNLLCRLCLVASACSVTLLARHWLRLKWWPSFVAGVLFGFGPYVTSQLHANTHLHLAFDLFPPLMVAGIYELAFSRRYPAVRLGIGLGLCFAGEMLVDYEAMAEFALVAGIALLLSCAVCLLRGQRQRVAAAIGRLVTAAVPALVLVLALAGWPLYEFQFGHRHLNAAIQPLPTRLTDGNDLFSALVPTSETLAHTGSLAARADSWVGGILSENGGYLGIVVLGLAITAMVLAHRQRSTAATASTDDAYQAANPPSTDDTYQAIGTPCAADAGRSDGSARIGLVPVSWLAATGVIAWVFSLGYRLRVDGHTLHWLWLPQDLMYHLGPLASAIATRFSIYVGLAAALLAAVAIDHIPAGFPRLGPAAGRPGSGATGLSSYVSGPDATTLLSHPTDRQLHAAVARLNTSRWLAGLLGVLAILSILPTTITMQPTGVSASTVSRLDKVIPAGSTVLTYPMPISPIRSAPYTYGNYTEAMLWQAMSGYHWNLLGGYATLPGKPGAKWDGTFPQSSEMTRGEQFLVWLADGIASPYGNPRLLTAAQAAPALRSTVCQRHVSTIVYQPLGHAPARAARILRRAFGTPSAQIGDLTVWKVSCRANPGA